MLGSIPGPLVVKGLFAERVRRCDGSGSEANRRGSTRRRGRIRQGSGHRSDRRGGQTGLRCCRLCQRNPRFCQEVRGKLSSGITIIAFLILLCGIALRLHEFLQILSVKLENVTNRVCSRVVDPSLEVRPVRPARYIHPDKIVRPYCLPDAEGFKLLRVR